MNIIFEEFIEIYAFVRYKFDAHTVNLKYLSCIPKCRQKPIFTKIFIQKIKLFTYKVRKREIALGMSGGEKIDRANKVTQIDTNVN